MFAAMRVKKLNVNTWSGSLLLSSFLTGSFCATCLQRCCSVESAVDLIVLASGGRNGNGDGDNS